MLNEPYLADRLHRVYNRRKKELNELTKKNIMMKELLTNVPTQTLNEAEVSSREYKEIRMLVDFDNNIFAPESQMHLPNNLLEDNPYSYFVNFDRLPAKIPENIKQLLYRPERMARLGKAYFRLTVKLQSDW